MMPAWLTLALTLFYVVWLFVVLFVLWAVWRKQVERLQGLETALIQDSKTTAEAAKTAAEAACMLAAHLKTNVVEGKTL